MSHWTRGVGLPGCHGFLQWRPWPGAKPQWLRELNGDSMVLFYGDFSMVTLIDGDSMIFYGDSMGYSMINGVFLWLWDLAGCHITMENLHAING